MAIRRMAAGFLAGASIVVALLIIVMLALFAAGIWSLLQQVAFQNYLEEGKVSWWQAMGQALAQSVGALPQYFWSARWGLLLLGLFGLVLAVVDSRREGIARPWRDYLGFVVTIGIVTALVVGMQYISRETMHGWIAEQPRLLSQVEVLLVSDATLLLIGVGVALGIAYLIWVAWNAWYTHWTAWLHVSRPAAAVASRGNVAAPPADDWRAYQDRLMRLKRGTPVDEQPAVAAPVPVEAQRSWVPKILAGLVAVTLLAYLLLRLYHAVGPALASGELWVTPEEPRTAVALSFSRPPRQITISNTAGSGTVDIRLSGSTGGTPLRQMEGMRLAGSADRYETAHMDLSGLAPGAYRIDASLRAQEGGLLRYVALSGGGTAGQLAGMAFGLATGLWLALAIVLLLEVLAERGILKGSVRG